MNSSNSYLPLTRPSNIGEILCLTVEKYPNRPAICFMDKCWPYSYLGETVSVAISRLKKHLPGRDCRIGIIGNNHPAYIVAYFAAQCLGVSTVEVGRNESLGTLVEIIHQTGAVFVLTDRDDLRTALVAKVPVESFEEFLTACEPKNTGVAYLLETHGSINPSKEASIVYTSGTTGFPKGVILSQGNFIFVVTAVIDYLGLVPEDRYALALPLSHTYGKTVMLTSFAVGGSIVLLENFQNLTAFLGRLAVNQCTILSAVPYHAHVLLKWGGLSRYDLSSMRKITFSGNKLPPSTIDLLVETFPKVEIFSMYGLTESTTRACYVPPSLILQKKDSCGRPLPGVELKIVKDDGSFLPTGEVGEVFLRGPNVMQGYFGDPELTSKTLTEGWLRTGDLGYTDGDGFLYLVGRKKEIIKCAGERISPSEIEEVLMQHPGVAEAAVIGSQDPLFGEVVHAYVVLRAGFEEEGELRTYCAKHLSHHKIPRRYTFMKELPKTPTGKVRKHLLGGG